MNKKNEYFFTHREDIFDSLLNILDNYSQGLKEYDLIEELKTRGLLYKNTLEGNLELFQTHFILFHTLYRLKDFLEENSGQTLEISALKIRILSCKKEKNPLESPDPLREYYLNPDNLKETTEKDVIELFNLFWEKFITSEEKNRALSILGLHEPVNYKDVKMEYKKLAKIHHPDKGGDSLRFREISNAMHILNKYYTN